MKEFYIGDLSDILDSLELEELNDLFESLETNVLNKVKVNNKDISAIQLENSNERLEDDNSNNYLMHSGIFGVIEIKNIEIANFEKEDYNVYEFPELPEIELENNLITIEHSSEHLVLNRLDCELNDEESDEDFYDDDLGIDDNDFLDPRFDDD